MNKKYAQISRLRKQVANFIENPKMVNTQYNILVDLSNHPQKDEVQEDWFYDEATNTFSPEGEVIYPELQPQEPTQLDRIETQLGSTLDQIRQESIDAYTLELIENGLL